MYLNYIISPSSGHGGGECGEYLKPMDRLGDGLRPSKDGKDAFRHGSEFVPTRVKVPNAPEQRIRATEHGFMADDPIADDEMDPRVIAARLLQKNPAARYYRI